MLLNGAKSFRCNAVNTSNVRAKHASFAKKVSQVTRIPEVPLNTFINRAFDRHMQAFDQLTNWAKDDYTVTSDLASTLVNVQKTDTTVEQSIDLTKDLN